MDGQAEPTRPNVETFMMGPAEVVGATHEPHPSFEHAHATSRVSATSRQTGETLPHGPIEPFDKRRVQILSSTRLNQRLVCLRQRSLRHPSNHFHDALFRRFLDHRSNQEVGPRLQPTPPAASCFRELFPKRTPDTARVCRLSVCQDQERTQRQTTGFHHLEQQIGRAHV